ncbi:hypothetical protein LIA77_00866 [Sarocladium implicatum]|nr:hypothetical protein LIA77_00866 [Sarocladium implicatum]
MAGSSPITFGVELEFNVKNNDTRSDGLAETISFLGNALVKETSLPIAVYGNPVRDHTEDTEEREEAPYEYYYILNESCAPAGRLDLVGMEITTPIRKADQIAAKLPEISTLIRALSQARCEIQIGKGTGLHVHVGSKNKLTLRMAQKCITLVSLLEMPFLQAIQPQARIQASTAYAGSVLSTARIVRNMAALGQVWHLAATYKREKAQVDAHIPPVARQNNRFWNKNGKQIESLLHGVWTAPDLEHLETGISRNGLERLGFALSLRGEDPHENEESTFEFRYGDMTFDAPYITMWVSVVTRIVEFAHLDATAFASKTRAILGALVDWDQARPETCFSGILRALDFTSGQVQEWVQLIAQHRAGNDRSVDQGRRLIPLSG